MEPAETALPTTKRAGAVGEEPRRERRVQHREEELLPVRHDDTPAQRLVDEAKSNKKSPRLGAHALVERHKPHRQALGCAPLPSTFLGRSRERLLASQGRGLRVGHAARSRPLEPRPGAGVRQAHRRHFPRGHLGRRCCLQ